MYYLILSVFLGACVFLDSLQIEYRIRHLFFAICCLLFVFTAGFKYETGVDWLEYDNMYKEIPSLSKIFEESSHKPITDYTDIGYIFVNSLTKSIDGGIQFVFFIVSAISSFLLYNSLSKYTTYRLTSIYLYYSLLFFVMDMSGIRQAIALNIFFLSITYIRSRKIFLYLLHILVAFLFHWSSIFLFPLYFILNRKISNRFSIILYGIFLTVFIVRVKWLSIVIEKISSYFLGDTISSRIDFYTTNSVFSSSRDISSSLITILLFTLIFLLLISRRKYLNEEPFFQIFFNLFLIQLFLFYCLYEFSQISERLRYYTVLSSIILIPYLLKSIYDIKLRFASSILVLAFGLYFSRSYVFEAEYTVAYSPYQNYLIYKIFNIQSNGKERLKKHSNINNSD